MTTVSGGDALIEGMSIRNSMSTIRQRIGVCPQHDVLWPQLTVREHLELFATLKGVPSEEIDALVRQLLEQVGLARKEHAQAQELSGGMKRKLSVAIAFCGKSKVVFLDEPTSGMVRRLQSHRTHRPHA
jgi:ATP-binding cassette, subfamily A (ABC1), member 3